MTMRRLSLPCSNKHSPRISAMFRAGSIVCGGYGLFRFAHEGISPRILTELDDCCCYSAEQRMLVRLTLISTVLHTRFPKGRPDDHSVEPSLASPLVRQIGSPYTGRKIRSPG